MLFPVCCFLYDIFCNASSVMLPAHFLQDFLRSCHSLLRSLETNLLSFPSLPVVAVVEREELKELLLEMLNKG